MGVICVGCGKPLDSTAVNLDSRIVKCGACDAVFDVSPRVPRTAAAAFAQQRAPAPVPRAIEIVEDGGTGGALSTYRDGAPPGRLVIMRRWYAPKLLLVLLGCLAWDGCVVGSYADAFQHSRISLLNVPLGIVQVAMAVGLTYYTLAGFVNRTWMTAERGTLTIRHAPLPWFGNRTMPAANIAKLYCTQVRMVNKESIDITYTLWAALKGGAKIPLITDLPDADQGVFLQQRFEDRLAIVDVPLQ
jgi:hypothetical protein